MSEGIETELEKTKDSGAIWPAKSCEVMSASGLVSAGGMIGVGGTELVGDAVGGNGVSADRRLSKWVNGELLPTLWGSAEMSHWLTTRNAVTGVFHSIRVQSVAHAQELAKNCAEQGYDAYYSVSEFHAEAKTRKGHDVAAVRAFWADIDVGIDKAAKGQGYATVEEAMAAVKTFRITAELPRPTHVVSSGGGLHYYWGVDEPMPPEQWLVYAKMFKALTKALGLLADPTRTADIASLMRVPGTLNFKDAANPRAVELIYASAELIDVSVMLNAIEAAHTLHCVLVKPPTPAGVKMQVPHASGSSVLPKHWMMIPAELSKLASALSVLSPDVEESIWSMHRVAPMARAARENPQFALDLYTLARHWSSGQLRGLPCKAWTTPGGNGLTGEVYFELQWARFLNDNYVGGRTLASIYFEAEQMGWKA